MIFKPSAHMPSLLVKVFWVKSGKKALFLLRPNCRHLSAEEERGKNISYSKAASISWSENYSVGKERTLHNLGERNHWQIKVATALGQYIRVLCTKISQAGKD